METLLIDNADSFTNNLQHLLVRALGCVPDIIPYTSLAECDISKYNLIVISAGPGTPEEYDYKKVLSSGKPVLGVCLGMQIINVYYGGRVSRLDDARHGITSEIHFNGGLELVAVYNSLCCSSIAECLEVTAVCDGVPMAVKHKQNPVAAVQFHPESFMTKNEESIIKDVLDSIGIC